MDNVKREATSDGRKQTSTEGSKTNLCLFCTGNFAECLAINIIFGDDVGNDNVVSCSSWQHSPYRRW